MSERWMGDMRDVATVMAYEYWRAREEADRLFARNHLNHAYFLLCARVDALTGAAGRMGLELDRLRPTEEEASAAALRIRSAPGPRRI